MYLEKLLGDWLRDSDWINMLTITEVAILCRAEVYIMIEGTHVTKTRYEHQIPVLLLWILQREAYLKYTKDCQENGVEIQAFEVWSNQKEKTLKYLKYWQTFYDMEIELLRYVRSIHIEDWACILDHYNYTSCFLCMCGMLLLRVSFLIVAFNEMGNPFYVQAYSVILGCYFRYKTGLVK